jgi:hypothetical protein
MKAGIVPRRKKDILDIIDRPIKTQVRMVHTVSMISACMIGTKLS